MDGSAGVSSLACQEERFDGWLSLAGSCSVNSEQCSRDLNISVQ